jgi:hypothetical protein
MITEYTQSGNGRFLASILSWWKISALAGKGGGWTPTPFHSTVFTITYKVAVYAEKADIYTPSISSLPCIYSAVMTIDH